MANARLMVRHLSDAGAPLLAGTDAGVPVVEPGSSLHEELAELIAAGLTPYAASRQPRPTRRGSSVWRGKSEW